MIYLSFSLVCNPGLAQTYNKTELNEAIAWADSLIENDPRQFLKNVESIIIHADGTTIFEKYYNESSPDSLHHIQSQTKSVVAILIGIAIDKGFVPSEREPVYNYFPDYLPSGDKLKSILTIHDVLAMSAGFDWRESEHLENSANDNLNMFESDSYLHYVLSKPTMIPGSQWFNYNSGCPVIIAGIIEKATGMKLDTFAEKYLFKPLGIDHYRWIKDSTGLCHAGGGLFLKPADMLKIGVMILNEGAFENQQIVSKAWISKATQPHLPTRYDISRYGYFFWIREMVAASGSKLRVLSAEGAGGQKLYILPDANMVIAFTEHNYQTPQVGPIFLKESILPLF